MRIVAILVPAFVLLTGCRPSVEQPSSGGVTNASPSVVLRVTNMVCEGCESTVREAIESVPGVESAVADAKTGTARVYVGAGVAVTPELVSKLIAAIEENPSHKASLDKPLAEASGR